MVWAVVWNLNVTFLVRCQGNQLRSNDVTYLIGRKIAFLTISFFSCVSNLSLDQRLILFVLLELSSQAGNVWIQSQTKKQKHTYTRESLLIDTHWIENTPNQRSVELKSTWILLYWILYLIRSKEAVHLNIWLNLWPKSPAHSISLCFAFGVVEYKPLNKLRCKVRYLFFCTHPHKKRQWSEEKKKRYVSMYFTRMAFL